MKRMTEKSLSDAFVGESQAYIKYMIYAEQADCDKKPNIARLFRAIAFAEYVHAKNHFKALAKLHKTTENLKDAWDGEDFEIEEMYPAYNAIANMQKEDKALKSIFYAIEAEKIHRDHYKKAEKRSKTGDISSDTIYICPICGFTHMGKNLPTNCPVCGAASRVFKEF